MIAPEKTIDRIAALTASAALKPCGTRAKYVGCKCRCRKCRTANANYQTARDKFRREGGKPDVLISSIKARDHILKLSDAGIGYKAVADAASVSRSVTGRILWGDRLRIRRSTSDRLCSVTTEAVSDGARVPSGPTLRILDGLISEGYTKTQLAKWMGSKAKSPMLQMRGDFIVARTASRVARMAILISTGKLERDR